jgi:periplasmic protein CpxP/Spy
LIKYFKENFEMKLRSLLMAGAAAVLIPVGGVVLTQSVMHTAALAQSTPAAAEQNAPGDRGKRGWGDKWQEQLNLSADQKAQIKQIRDQERSSSEGLRQQMKAAADKQKSLMTGNATDDQLRQQNREIQALRQQIGERRFDTKLKIRQVLTPEQRVKAAQLRQEHRGRGGRHGGSGGKQSMGMMRNQAF